VTNSSGQHVRSSLLRESRVRLLAFLLVGTLLLCHGVFGVSHLCSTFTAPTHQTHEHPTFADETVGGHEHPSCHLTGAEYFAVLLTAFLGLLLGLLLSSTRLWGRVTAPLCFVRLSYPLVLPPPRGPTAPLIQVFRL
jgi:hypothetical protein